VSEELLNSLVEIVVDVPVIPATYAIHLETLNTLIILLSVQMYMLSPKEPSILYGYLMGTLYGGTNGASGRRCPAIHAPLFMKTLLLNYVKQEMAPEELLKAFGEGDRSSLLYGLATGVASGIWSVLTLGIGTGATPDDATENRMSKTPLADQSLHLILILANHCTIDAPIGRGLDYRGADGSLLPHNPYRQALFSFTNSQGQAVSQPTEAVASFRLDYSRLYESLTTTLGSATDDGQTTLLLYLLLHRNSNVKEFLLSKTNVEQLALPILKILYTAQEQNSHHIYMALIILLVLSEDDFFNSSVHDITLKNVTWYTERPLTEITLGGLLVLVVVRTIQANMARMRDKYLHTNCLACLANMSSTFKNLNAYTAQKLLGLLQSLSKKHAKLIETIRNSDYDVEKIEKSGDDDLEDLEVEEMVQDLTVLEEVLRMILEILNSTITNSLHHNPNLVYTLLYKRETFDPFRTHPMFQDVVQNIDLVLGYFSKRLDAITNTKDGPRNPSVVEVLDCIKQGALNWPRDRLKKFPELKFKYVEEEEPEEFFVPYIWTLVFHGSRLYWDPERIQLFNAAAPEG